MVSEERVLAALSLVEKYVMQTEVTTFKSPHIIMAALAGSIVFTVTAKDFNTKARLALFTASFIVGVLSAHFVAGLVGVLLQDFLKITLEVPDTIGALIGAVVSVRLLSFFCEKPEKTTSIFDLLKRK
ncbi:putative holin [Trabulsiella odontotermitis]|uniref:putative holin n=2 Tax=Trabulsiella odontotermitis TaxID=379893 RepID=UPI0006BA43C7|nr:putative holin [Trabulsiella odontotermitis]